MPLADQFWDEPPPPPPPPPFEWNGRILRVEMNNPWRQASFGGMFEPPPPTFDNEDGSTVTHYEADRPWEAGVPRRLVTVVGIPMGVTKPVKVVGLDDGNIRLTTEEQPEGFVLVTVTEPERAKWVDPNRVMMDSLAGLTDEISFYMPEKRCRSKRNSGPTRNQLPPGMRPPRPPRSIGPTKRR